MFLSHIKLPPIRKDIAEEYRLYKFRTNILRMLYVGLVLVLEQFALALLIAENGSTSQHIFFYSSAGMGVLALLAVYFTIHEPSRITIFHEIFEMSFGLFGMMVALNRLLVIENDITSVPTIYIAVLYGVAVIFVFNVWQGIFAYALITSLTVILLPLYNPDIIILNFRSDVITNGVIAWVIIYLNSHRFISSFLDKKKIEIINSELREQSIRDGLTGLYNRRKLDEVYSEVCLKASRYENDFAVIMIDIDFFKRINDNYGHHIGDIVLIEFAQIIQNNIREVDVCGRWGGEEFFVICQETELEYARQLAERLREKIELNSFGSSAMHITASFGAASWSSCSSDAELLKLVDSRLYQAKSSGRNLVVAE